MQRAKRSFDILHETLYDIGRLFKYQIASVIPLYNDNRIVVGNTDENYLNVVFTTFESTTYMSLYFRNSDITIRNLNPSVTQNAYCS